MLKFQWTLCGRTWVLLWVLALPCLFCLQSRPLIGDTPVPSRKLPSKPAGCAGVTGAGRNVSHHLPSPSTREAKDQVWTGTEQFSGTQRMQWVEVLKYDCQVLDTPSHQEVEYNSPWMWAGLRNWLVIKRMQQKWHWAILEIGSEKVTRLPVALSGDMHLGNPATTPWGSPGHVGSPRRHSSRGPQPRTQPAASGNQQTCAHEWGSLGDGSPICLHPRDTPRRTA